MKNTVIKGDGTSRKLKAPSSLPESFSEWRTQLLAGNATLDIALNPDGCETVGTPLSRANLLSDGAKTALGLASEDPTVSEALEYLGNAQPIIGTSAPTTSTIGAVGQSYIDTTNKRVWHCTAVSGSSYTWISADNEIANAKQDASTAITRSNIADQSVATAKWAGLSNGDATGTYMLRDQLFATYESTPTTNGNIAWVYG